MSVVKNWMFALKRRMYRGGRPGWLARRMNWFDARQYALGAAPRWAATLQVRGRTSGKPVSVPVVIADVDGREYLVSMLGDDANWVKNVRAAGGDAVLRHRGRRRVHLEEVPVVDRPPILKAYLRRAIGARPHYPVAPDAPLADFASIAADYPAFRIDPVVDSPGGLPG